MLIKKEPPIGKLEILGEKKREVVYVDKKGNIVERPKWLNEKIRAKKRKSFVIPELPWRKNDSS